MLERIVVCLAEIFLQPIFLSRFFFNLTIARTFILLLLGDCIANRVSGRLCIVGYVPTAIINLALDIIGRRLQILVQEFFHYGIILLEAQATVKA